MIVVHGLGYVGLTCAVHFAKAGLVTLGYDPDDAVVQALKAGQPKAGEFLSYLDADVRHLVDEGLLRATSSWDDVAKSNSHVHILAVPTEKDDEPYMGIVKSAVHELLRVVSDGALILIESTLTPGTMEVIVLHEERLRRGGVLFAHAPRRDWFADPKKNLGTLKRIVGGYNEAATYVAYNILTHVTPPENILLTDYRTAELVKPLENALFHLPIMLGHELAMSYADHDIVRALELATTHWRFESFGGLYVGLGSGGRCVPMGSKYLDEGSSAVSSLLRTALKVETDITKSVCDLLSDCDSIAILGIGYRPGFSDVGFSPGLRIVEELYLNDVDFFLDDPHVPREVLEREMSRPHRRNASWGNYYNEHNAQMSAVVLATPHAAYREHPNRVDWRKGQIVIDARGFWSGYADFFRLAGVTYRQVGKPGWLDE